MLLLGSCLILAGFAIASIEVAIKQDNAELKSENGRLHNLVTSLHDRFNSMSTEASAFYVASAIVELMKQKYLMLVP